MSDVESMKEGCRPPRNGFHGAPVGLCGRQWHYQRDSLDCVWLPPTLLENSAMAPWQ